jgi:hypothetical protein
VRSGQPRKLPFFKALIQVDAYILNPFNDLFEGWQFINVVCLAYGCGDTFVVSKGMPLAMALLE